MRDTLARLHEQLLRAGMARRFADRAIGELRDHLSDLEQEYAAAGLPPESAQETARRRLGDINLLALELLGDKRALSIAHRAPWAIFVLAPLAAYAIAVTAGLTLLACIATSPGFAGPLAPLGAVVSSCLGVGLPLAVGWALARLASRQHSPWSLPIAGIIALCFLAAMVQLDVRLDRAGGEIALGLVIPSLLQIMAQSMISTAPLWLPRLTGAVR